MSENKSMMATFGGRKFLIVVAWTIGAALCVIFKMQVDAELLYNLRWVTGLYFAGNLGSDAINRYKAGGTVSSSAVDALAAMLAELNKDAKSVAANSPTIAILSDALDKLKKIS